MSALRFVFIKLPFVIIRKILISAVSSKRSVVSVTGRVSAVEAITWRVTLFLTRYIPELIYLDKYVFLRAVSFRQPATSLA